MQFPILNASTRIRSGKGPARRLRQKGHVPAVVYGKDMGATPISIVPADLKKALSGPLRINTVLALSIEGTEGTRHAVVKDHQFDPITRDLLHVDFVTIKDGEKLKVNVPLKLTGRSIGQQGGGTLSVLFRSLPVECLPEDIPESLTADISHLDLNDQLNIADIQLPENVTVMVSGESTVAVVLATRISEEKPEGEEGEGEGAAVADGDASDKKPEA